MYVTPILRLALYNKEISYPGTYLIVESDIEYDISDKTAIRNKTYVSVIFKTKAVSNARLPTRRDNYKIPTRSPSRSQQLWLKMLYTHKLIFATYIYHFNIIYTQFGHNHWPGQQQIHYFL